MSDLDEVQAKALAEAYKRSLRKSPARDREPTPTPPAVDAPGEREELAKRYAFDKGIAHGNRTEPAWHYSIIDYLAGYDAATARLQAKIEELVDEVKLRESQVDNCAKIVNRQLDSANDLEALKKLMDESRCGVRAIKSHAFSVSALNAADYLFKEHGSDPGEYQGFLLGVAWAIITEQR